MCSAANPLIASPTSGPIGLRARVGLSPTSPQAEAGMRAVPRHAAGHDLPLSHDDPFHPGAAQRHRRAEAGRAAAHDEDVARVDAGLRHDRPPAGR